MSGNLLNPGIGIIGLYEFAAELTLHDAVFPGRVETITSRTVIWGSGLAAAAARVDTGASRNAIAASPKVEHLGDTIRGEWSSGGILYDIYQEYGTSRGITPNWHHRNAFERVKPEYDRLMENAAGLS